MKETYMARPVTVVSISIKQKGESRNFTEEMIAAACAEAEKGADLIALPEVWTPYIAETANGTYSSPALDRLKETAKRFRTYIVAPMKRYASAEELRRAWENPQTGLYRNAEKAIFNSAILIDRNGEAVFSYDKAYPVLAEMYSAPLWETTFDVAVQSVAKDPVTIPGTGAAVYDCDFGRVGFGICFDMNYADLFLETARKGAELLIWSAAYSGGKQAAMMAGICNYYVVTSTIKAPTGDCRFCDITGDELAVHIPEPEEEVYVTKMTLDLDRTIFHRDYNRSEIERALRENPGRLEADNSREKEGWIILRALTPEMSVRDAVERYGLTPLREYKFGKGERALEELRNGPVGRV